MNLGQKLIYVQDPLCGWCYAIDTAVRYVEQNLNPDTEFEVLNIGLFIDKKMKAMPDFRSHLRQGAKMVEKVSDARFSERFFQTIVENDHYVYESFTAGLALQALAEISSRPKLELISEIQKRFFVDAQSASCLETYTSIAAKYAIPPLSFAALFFHPDTRARFEKERVHAGQILLTAQSNSVPCLLVKKGDRLIKVDHENNRTPEELLKNVKRILGDA
jgi:putative protein-disulfide isomerase